MNDMTFKSGYVAILGLPNVGKSTLLNALLGQKIAITNPKPQTTRKRILGILSEENYQIIFLDTPGILKPGYLLQEKMMEDVERSVNDADVILFIDDISTDMDGTEIFSSEFVAQYIPKEKPKILLLNKVDLSNDEDVKEKIAKFESIGIFESIIPISATLSFNLNRVIEEILEYLPEGPKYFPDDIASDEKERFFVSEIIREKILELYQEEIPYSCEVYISDFLEKEGRKDLIRAEIIVERESQKGIIIGKQGAAIKKLGETARRDIEKFLEREVFLDLRVKVREKWRNDEKMLKYFGYSKPKE